MAFLNILKKNTGTVSKKTTGAKTGDDNNIIPYLLYGDSFGNIIFDSEIKVRGVKTASCENMRGKVYL